VCEQLAQSLSKLNIITECALQNGLEVSNQKHNCVLTLITAAFGKMKSIYICIKLCFEHQHVK